MLIKIAKYLTCCICCFAMYATVHAQEGSVDEMKLYRDLLRVADSLKKAGKAGVISPDAYRLADSLGSVHPSGYFGKATELLACSRFNDAAFLYYTGRLRYRYYNSANPDYKASEDGALLASLKYVVGEPVDLYLKDDINNFIAILEASKNYYKSKEFSFFPASREGKKFDEQSEGIQKLIDEVKSNKKQYAEDWAKQINEFQKGMDKMGSQTER